MSHKYLKYTFLLIFIWFTIHKIKAKTTYTDSTEIVSNYVSLEYSDNLDSLLYNWYITNTLVPIYADTSFIDIENLEIKEFNDSVYIQRLSELPDYIELSYNKVIRNFIHLYSHQ